MQDRNHLNGAFIFSRSMFNSDAWYKPPEYFKIFFYLIGKARHKSGIYKGYLLERGQHFCDYNELKEQLEYNIGYRKKKYNDSFMKNLMKYLRDYSMITTTKKPRGMVVTICNYNKYQDLKSYEKTIEKTNEKTMSKPRTFENPLSINKNEEEFKKEKKENSQIETEVSTEKINLGGDLHGFGEENSRTNKRERQGNAVYAHNQRNSRNEHRGSRNTPLHSPKTGGISQGEKEETTPDKQRGAGNKRGVGGEVRETANQALHFEGELQEGSGGHPTKERGGDGGGAIQTDVKQMSGDGGGARQAESGQGDSQQNLQRSIRRVQGDASQTPHSTGELQEGSRPAGGKQVFSMGTGPTRAAGKSCSEERPDGNTKSEPQSTLKDSTVNLKATEMATILSTLIIRNNPTLPHAKNKSQHKKDIAAWAIHINKLHALDKQSWEDIEKVIRWCQDEQCWWNDKIMSGSKLRIKFGQLFVKMSKPQKNGFKSVQEKNSENIDFLTDLLEE